MTPEIPLLSMSREPRVRITEINPPRVEQANFFKRAEPVIDARFIPLRPSKTNYFQSRAGSISN